MGRPSMRSACWAKKSSGARASALQIMAERTGGIAFFPKTLDEVDEISRTVAHDIRNQYTIGYKPTTPKSSGGYRADQSRCEGQGIRKAHRPHQERLLRRAGTGRASAK